MTSEEQIRLVVKARDLLIQVHDSIPNEFTTCECCGMKTFKSFREKQMKDNLGGAITRTERILGRLSQIENEEEMD